MRIRPILPLIFFLPLAGSPSAVAQVQPITSLHYVAGGNGTDNFQTSLGLGFRLVDAGYPDQLNGLPSDVKALVWVGMCNGVDSEFTSKVDAWKGNSQLFAFYLMDEPDPSGVYQNGTVCMPASLKTESDYIHANLPGAKTFIVVMGYGDYQSTDNPPSYMPYAPFHDPTYEFNPATTGIDLYGIDVYPCRHRYIGTTEAPDGCMINEIPAFVAAAIASGIPQSAIVPVYQAYGNNPANPIVWSTTLAPTADQEWRQLAAWGAVIPTPPFDYAYVWAQFDFVGLSQLPDVQEVFASHNTATSPSQDATPSSVSGCGISGTSDAGLLLAGLLLLKLRRNRTNRRVQAL
ncbi:MAG: hypothetical protein V1798_02550 [Pseudomonadota bacterium]